MPQEVYEVVAQGARYWFLFLMAVIVWRSYRWFAKDRRQRKKRLKLLPDAGYIGELVVQSGNEELGEGAVMPVPREGVLGRLRGSDLYVPVQGVAAKHLWFQYEDGKGLMMKAFMGLRASVDGEETGRHKGAYMAHGSRLYVGEAVLRLRMFAGFETTERASSHAMEAALEEEGDQAGEAAMTAERVSLWQAQQSAMQQQYWLMAQQAMAERMAAGEAPDDSDEDNVHWDEAWDAGGKESTLYAQAYAEYNGDEADGDEEDDSEWGENKRDDAPEASEASEASMDGEEGGPLKPARSLFSPFEPVVETLGKAESGGKNMFTVPMVFYPPVQDDADQEEPWPYAEYPQPNADWEGQAYAYPGHARAASEDEDLTDAAAAPKSLYVEPDEAERAKRLLWDRYFRGGAKR